MIRFLKRCVATMKSLATCPDIPKWLRVLLVPLTVIVAATPFIPLDDLIAAALIGSLLIVPRWRRAVVSAWQTSAA